MSATLYLIPSTIGDTPIEKVLPPEIAAIINTITFYIAENERTVRRFLIKAGLKVPINELTFFVLDKHTTNEEKSNFLKPIIEGHNVAVISEAGCPGVADPGSEIVRMAHSKGIKVVPLVGPSSILLALMASGMNGQSFAFLGYLPVKPNERAEKIKQIERRSSIEHQTQIFIEAPYRNMQMLDDLIKYCNASTRICIAADITTDDEFIQTKTVVDWQKNKPQLHKRPVIFLLDTH